MPAPRFSHDETIVLAAATPKEIEITTDHALNWEFLIQVTAGNPLTVLDVCWAPRGEVYTAYTAVMGTPLALGGGPLIVFGTNRPVAKVKFRIASNLGGSVRINGAGAP